MNKMMPIKDLMKLRSHAEYGAKFVGDLTENDLSKAGDWKFSFSDLKNHIQTYGILIPLRVHKYESGEMMLGNGHHRAVIAMQLGIKNVPVNIIDV